VASSSDSVPIVAPPPGWSSVLARRITDLWHTVLRLIAFTLITLGTLVTKAGHARSLIHPLIAQQLFRSGARMVPMVCFLGVLIGVVVVGQAVAKLQEVGAENLIGVLLVTVVVRELSPLIAVFVVLARVGTATVVELGTARSQGEVEALEAMGVDPIHYLVVPRVIGFTASVMGLSVYLLVTTLLGGYVFAFARGLPLTLPQYLSHIAAALDWLDFPLLVLKTGLFGGLTGLVICYQGLAHPVRLEEVGSATSRTVALCGIGCLLIDALLVPLYLLL
jgi:phospholipid/cholesterol/gamma-HCH transport system permease protein